MRFYCVCVAARPGGVGLVPCAPGVGRLASVWGVSPHVAVPYLMRRISPGTSVWSGCILFSLYRYLSLMP